MSKRLITALVATAALSTGAASAQYMETCERSDKVLDCSVRSLTVAPLSNTRFPENIPQEQRGCYIYAKAESSARAAITRISEGLSNRADYDIRRNDYGFATFDRYGTDASGLEQRRRKVLAFGDRMMADIESIPSAVDSQSLVRSYIAADRVVCRGNTLDNLDRPLKEAFKRGIDGYSRQVEAAIRYLVDQENQKRYEQEQSALLAQQQADEQERQRTANAQFERQAQLQAEAIAAQQVKCPPLTDLTRASTVLLGLYGAVVEREATCTKDYAQKNPVQYRKNPAVADRYCSQASVKKVIVDDLRVEVGTLTGLLPSINDPAQGSAVSERLESLEEFLVGK